MRTNENGYAIIMLNIEPGRKRGLGRPRLRWIDGVWAIGMEK